MTVSALQALALRTDLAGGLSRFADRSARSTARATALAREMSTSVDLRFPGVPGPRPLSTRLLNMWVTRVQWAAAADDQVPQLAHA